MKGASFGRAIAVLVMTFLLPALPPTALAHAQEKEPMPKKAPLWPESLAWANDAKSFFIAPDGKPENAGTMDAPWDIASGLGGKHKVAPGSVIWLRGGTYGTGGATTYHVHLKGTEQRPIIVRQFPGERATIDGGLLGGGAWFWLWGFEIKNSDPNRKLTRKGKPRGVDIAARGLKCINLIIHDTSGATTQWKPIGDQGELHGCVFWGNGVYDPSFAGGARRGGGTYAQNKDGTRYLTDVISFRNFASGLYAGSSGSAHINGFHVEGNVLFDNYEWGFLTTAKKYPIERLKVIANFTYWKRGTKGGKGSVQLGYYGIENRDAEVRDNYFVLGPHARSFYIKKFRDLTLTGNTVVGPGLLLRVSPGEKIRFVAAKNAYFGGGATPFRYGDKNLDFAGWQAATGSDADSRHTPEYPADVKVFVRPNKYEPGRGHVIVYNWAGKDVVKVDVSRVLTEGVAYEIRNAQNYFADPVAKGIYDGKPVTLPMNLPEIAMPIGECPHIRQYLRPTAPEFNVFVILSETSAPATP